MNAVLILLIATSCTFLGTHGDGIEENQKPEKPPLRPLIIKVVNTSKFVYFSANPQDVQVDGKRVEFSTKFRYYCPVMAGNYILTEVPAGQNCALEVRSAMILSSKTVTSCGPLDSEGNHAGKLYEFVYIIRGHADKPAVYKFCYNIETENVVYTWHKLWSPILFGKSDDFGELANYHSDTKSTDNYGIRPLGDTFQKMAQHYKNGTGEGMITDFMVPPEDMVFGNWQKTTYHYANIKPSSKRIKEMWANVNKRIREKAITTNTEFEIFTRVTELKGTWGVETVWRKIVYDRGSKAGVMILTTENRTPNKPSGVKTIQRVESFVKKTCDENEIKPCFTSENGVICCMVKQMQLDLFGENFPVAHYLDVEEP